MTKLPMADVPESGDRLVIRPSLLASIFNAGLSVAFAVLFALASTTRGNSIGDIAFELSLALMGLLLALHLISMRVEANGSHVAKLYFFGLLSRQIPYRELKVSHHAERSSEGGGSYAVEDFQGLHTSFSLIPFWVWRTSDVQAVVERTLRYTARLHRPEDKSAQRCPNPDCAGAVMSKVSGGSDGELWRCEICGTEAYVSTPRAGR